MKLKILKHKKFLETLLAPETKLSIPVEGETRVSKNWELSRRTIPEHLLHYIVSGGYLVSAGSKTFFLKPHSLLWISPGVEQFIKMPGNIKETHVLFWRFSISGKENYRFEEDFLVLEKQALLLPLLRQLLPENRLASTYEKYHQKCLVGELLARVFNQADGHIENQRGLKPHQRQLALRFIGQNTRRRYNIAELAKFLSLNTDYFSRQFRESFKITPQAYIKQQRIQGAAVLLSETNLTISEIAFEFGYEDIYFFSRQFKEVRGVSPSQWRKSF